MYVCEVRVESDGLSKVVYGLGELPLLEQDVRQVVPADGEVGLDSDGFGVASLGVLPLPPCLVEVAQVRVRLYQVRVEQDGHPEAFHRLLHISLRPELHLSRSYA